MGSSNHKLSFVHSYLHFFRQITEEFGDPNHTQDHWGVVINAKPRKKSADLCPRKVGWKHRGMILQLRPLQLGKAQQTESTCQDSIDI